MKKIKTTAGVLHDIRRKLAQTSPEMVDLGMKIATAKNTAIDHGYAGGLWGMYPVTIFVSDGEYLVMEPHLRDLDPPARVADRQLKRDFK